MKLVRLEDVHFGVFFYFAVYILITDEKNCFFILAS